MDHSVAAFEREVRKGRDDIRDMERSSDRRFSARVDRCECRAVSEGVVAAEFREARPEHGVRERRASVEAALPEGRHLVRESDFRQPGLERGDVLPAEAAARDLRAPVGLARRREVGVERRHVKDGRRAVHRDERGRLLVIELDRPVAVGHLGRAAIDRHSPCSRCRKRKKSKSNRKTKIRINNE